MLNIFILQITPNMAEKVSLAEFSYLGISDVADVNILRQRCHLHAAALNGDETHVNGQTMELANLLSLGFSVKQLSKMYLVSEMTIRRRIVSFGMTNWKYDNIDNMDLENAMYDIKETHPDIGEKMMGLNVAHLPQIGISP